MAKDDARTKLRQVMAARGDTLLYLYDFGDDWEQLITLKQIEPRRSRCRCWPPTCSRSVRAWPEFLVVLHAAQVGAQGRTRKLRAETRATRMLRARRG